MTEGAKPKPKTLRAAARELTEDALKALAKVMLEGSSEHARIAAASAILDRGHGKSGQTVKTGADQAAGPVVVRWADKPAEATADPSRNSVCSSREPAQT